MPVPYFVLFLCFRKVTQEIFSELDETKAKPPIFTKASQRPKMRQREARSQAHHRGAWPSPWLHRPMVRLASPTSDDALSPIKSPRQKKNLRTDLVGTPDYPSRISDMHTIHDPMISVS
jgi:hypothetical protein